MRSHPVAYGILLSLIAYASYAFGDAIGKYLTMNGFSPFQISLAYSTTGFAFLLAFSSKLGGLESLFRTKHVKLHIIRALMFAPTQALNYYAFSKMPMANVYTVLFMTPFITTIFAHYLLHEKTSIKAWMCILCGFTGVIIVNQPDVDQIGWPLIACAASALFGASRFIVTRKMGYSETTFSLSIVPCISIMLVSIIPALMTPVSVTLVSLSWLVLGGIFFACGTIFISLSLLQKINLSLLTPFHYSQIIWGILLGILVFGNMPDTYTWIGYTIIIISGIALIYTKEKSTKAPAKPLEEL